MSDNGTLDWSRQRVILTGGSGFLGRHVVEVLKSRGVSDDRLFVPRQAKHDLTTEDGCRRMYADAFGDERATMVIHLAAKVGGIGANRTRPGEYFYANMAMAMFLIEQARRDGLIDREGRFCMVGSICEYPKFTPVPFEESEIWNGYPEETNAPYGIAKRAAWQMLDAYQRQYGMRAGYVLPVNLYGPHDNFDLESSHVIPALIRKCLEAKERGDDFIEVWGTGSASREFLYVEDAASGVVRAAEVMDTPTPINLGVGREIPIKELVQMIVTETGFGGELRWDTTKPDGQPRRCLDTSRAKELLGWEAKVGFEDGLRRTIEWYRANPS